MKKLFITLLLLLPACLILHGQGTDQLVSSCVLDAGPNCKYLKDFRIQLSKAPSTVEMRYKTQMSLWKNTKYKFSMCTAEDSKGELILTIGFAEKIRLSN